METQVSQVDHSVNRRGDVPCAGANAKIKSGLLWDQNDLRTADPI